MSEVKEAPSPKILNVGWGKIEVENLGVGKDLKLWPGGGRSWDWREYGTGHSRGIQPGDCKELVENRCSVVVLSRGMFKRLKVAQETLEYLRDKNVEIVVEETKKAVRHYNNLAEEGRAVGGLFHTTC